MPASVIGDAVSATSESWRFELERPLELQRTGGLAPSGLVAVTYGGAWLAPRHVGERIEEGRSVGVYVWLIEQGAQPDAAPDQEPDLWAIASTA
jgi:hypothetical protein